MTTEKDRRMGESTSVPNTISANRALSQRNSPYRTVGSLAEYAARLLDGAAARG